VRIAIADKQFVPDLFGRQQMTAESHLQHITFFTMKKPMITMLGFGDQKE